MCRDQDEAYARTLLRIAEADAETALDPGPGAPTNRRAVALWMADELQREAGRLDLSERTAAGLRDTASAIRHRVTAVRLGA